jgi:Ca2+-binding EF-hand superfamily protein
VSKKELKEMLEKTFSFRLSPEHFKELMLLLDPQHTNYISYQDFLDLFEQREPLVSVTMT